ncbi:MAG: site-2 protease family protein [Planctomycetota bacterium]
MDGFSLTDKDHANRAGHKLKSGNPSTAGLVVSPGRGSLRRKEKLRPKRRAELQITRDEASQRWIVFDCASRKTFRLGDFEAWLLQYSDGNRTLAELAEQLKHKFGNSAPEPEHTLQTLMQLQQNQLLYGLESLLEETGRARKPSYAARWVSAITVWRIPGFNADRRLEFWSRRCEWLFSSLAVQVWLGIICLATLLALSNWERFVQQGVTWQWMLRPSNLGSLFVVFILTRAMHELGHALVCKRFGVRCPDMGLLVVLGTPCVYCDVSESWKLPERWKRAAISAAGMYVELIVAALATFIWYFTIDGTVNSIALHAMLVCSLSTLLINGNPLMKFDGYHLLADWLDEANLRQNADRKASQQIGGWILGTKTSQSIESASRRAKIRTRLLIAYSLTCHFYRLFLAISIATVLAMIYSNWYLAWVGRILAAIVVFAMCVLPILRWGNQLMKQATTNTSRFRVALVGACFLIIAILVPIPQRRSAEGWVQPVRAQGVYAQSDAQLVRCSVDDGQPVEQSQSLFQLKNDGLAIQFLERKAEANKARIQSVAMRRQRDMHGQEVDLAVAETHVQTTEALAASAQRELAQLQVEAPITGIFSAASVLEKGEDNKFARASRTWDDNAQVGGEVPQGTLLGVVRSSESMVVVPLKDAQLAELAQGAQVRVCLNRPNANVVHAELNRIVRLDEVEQYWLQVQQTEASQHSASAGSSKAQPRQFAALVSLPKDLEVHPGTQVQTVIVAPSMTLAQVCKRWVLANLNSFAH